MDVNVLREQLDINQEWSRALMLRAREASYDSRQLRSRPRRDGCDQPPAPCTARSARRRAPGLPAPAAGTGRRAMAAVASAEAAADELRRENAQLREALVGRPLVDQARGVLMAVAACGADDALKILVGTSQHANVKLRRVAELVVASAAEGDPPEPVATHLRQELARHAAGR
ncbi:ANTAR domain-containing protein [Streptomyces flavofungini]|uniref:ANTAR domain-containing protein n=1 Tax=Streptomyces flavofungini TaxID=68200 RepID=UPI0034DE3E21